MISYLIDFFIIVILLLVFPIVFLYEKMRDRKIIEKFMIEGIDDSTKFIIFIHGLQDDHTVLRNQINYFKKDYKCLVIDRTAGDNNRYMDINEIYSIILNNTVNATEMHCIAASAGCRVAVDMQKKYKIFNKMILLNMLFNYDESRVELLEKNFESVVQISSYSFLEMFCYSINRDYCFSFPIWLIGKTIRNWACRKYKVDVYKDANLIFKKRWRLTLSQRKATAYAYFDSLYTFNNSCQIRLKSEKSILPDLNVLSIIGTRDNIGHLNTYDIENFANRYKNNLILLLGAGHWFYETDPSRTNELITSFFEGIRPNKFVSYIKS